MKLTSRGARSLAAGFAVFGLSFALRISSYSNAFREGHPQLIPLDDLYHAKRIIFSAFHFPKVLDFDPDRGVRGAFCPWPPLYDLAMGGQARLLGSKSPKEVLRSAVWFPPIFTSCFAGFLAALLARRKSLLAGLVSGLILALSPGFVGASRLGSIDHHFLEPALLLAIVAATVSIARARSGRAVVGFGLLFALALAVALFIQTALLLAAGLALIAILLVHGRSSAALASAALGFALAAAAILLYRIARPPGYPDGPWYLGVSHVAALTAAAVACACAAWRTRGARQGRSALSAGLSGIVLGGLAAIAIPGALSGVAEGVGFFGGDPWLREIQEFRPLFFGRGANPLLDLCALGGGALLAVPFAIRSFRSGSVTRRVLSVFAIGFLFAAVKTARFSIPAVAVLAIPAALVVSDELDRRRFGLASAAAAIALLPTLAGCFLALPEISTVIPPGARPMVAAAGYLRSRGESPGRVLGPWSAGHAFDVIGGHPVVVDNFGAMEGRHLFDEAVGLLLSPREETVARYCRDHGVRFVVIENPTGAVESTARMLEVPVSLYVEAVTSPGGKLVYYPTRLLTASFWWRAYRGAEPAPGTSAPFPPFRFFRLRYPDPARFGNRLPVASQALQIWEFVHAGS